ncbi:hypothetical protein ES703_31638 [subsurface metagenome]
MLRENIPLVRWIARTLGGLFVSFFVGVIVYETYSGRGAQFFSFHRYPLKYVFHVLGLYTVLVGMIIAWKWECFGAALIIGGVAEMGITPSIWVNQVTPFIILVAGLFFLCWLVDRKHNDKPKAEQKE